MENEKENFIADHALLTEENFLLATQVAKAFEEIVSRLVRKFLKKLSEELHDALGSEWEVKCGLEDEDNGFDIWYFIIYKKKWLRDEKAGYFFGFEPDRKKLNDFFFYTMRNTDIIKDPLDAVNQALNEQYKKGRKSAALDWWQYVDQDYLNWTNDETLPKLYRQEEMVRYFTEQFIKMKNVIEPIVDAEMVKA